MQTFKQFLNEAPRKERTQVVSVEEFIRWADRNAKLYLEGPHFLYRGGSGTAQKGLRVGNAAGEGITPRQSANTHNNYTLWIDNNPAFEGWPKRSLSFIGTDDRDVAEGFGGAALLVVSDHAKVGIVGENDLWEVQLAPIGITIEELNGMTQSIIRQNLKSYEQLEQVFKAHELQDVKDEIGGSWDGADEVIETMEKRGLDNLFELWEFLVKPGIFAGKTDGVHIVEEAARGEVWIEGECGFIPHVKRLSEADANRITEWADQYPHLLEEMHQHWAGYHEDQWGDE